MGRGNGAPDSSEILFGPPPPRLHKADPEPADHGPRYWFMGDRDSQVLQISDELLTYLEQNNQEEQARLLFLSLEKYGREKMPFRVAGFLDCHMARFEQGERLLLGEQSTLIYRQPCLEGHEILLPPYLTQNEPVPPDARFEIIRPIDYRDRSAPNRKTPGKGG